MTNVVFQNDYGLLTKNRSPTTRLWISRFRTDRQCYRSWTWKKNFCPFFDANKNLENDLKLSKKKTNQQRHSFDMKIDEKRQRERVSIRRSVESEFPSETVAKEKKTKELKRTDLLDEMIREETNPIVWGSDQAKFNSLGFCMKNSVWKSSFFQSIDFKRNSESI